MSGSLARRGGAAAPGNAGRAAGSGGRVRPGVERPGTARPGATDGLERKIMGVPARIMRPRLIFIAVTALLVCFGLVMIYSSSSVEALADYGDAAYYLRRQCMFALAGAALAVCMALVDYHRLCSGAGLMLAWALATGLLVAVLVFGKETNGATRWIELAGFRLQPSEFAKVSLVLSAANICNGFFAERSFGLAELLLRLAAFVVLPLVLIVVQPDKGTAGVIVVMLIAMVVTSGFDTRYVVRIVGAGLAVALIVVLSDSYSRARVLTMLDPWSDEWGSGYQLTQGFMAFGSGGVFGVGLGMSRQKYSYLPEAHNDFIFAIIGEELGLVGTLAVLAAFAVLAFEGLQVARSAPDLTGRLVAAGATALLICQFFLNVMGVLGLFPLSGKPLPFLSYGGSSLMGSLMLVGAVVGVSLRSRLPETVYERRRRAITLAADDGAAAVPAPGYARAARSGLRLVDGGAGRPQGGYQRIDLGPSAAERLRGGRGWGSSGKT